MSVMILVTGNSMIKAKTGRREQNITAFPHAIKQLTEAQYPRPGRDDGAVT